MQVVFKRNLWKLLAQITRIVRIFLTSVSTTVIVNIRCDESVAVIYYLLLRIGWVVFR